MSRLHLRPITANLIRNKSERNRAQRNGDISISRLVFLINHLVLTKLTLPLPPDTATPCPIPPRLSPLLPKHSDRPVDRPRPLKGRGLRTNHCSNVCGPQIFITSYVANLTIRNAVGEERSLMIERSRQRK